MWGKGKGKGCEVREKWIVGYVENDFMLCVCVCVCVCLCVCVCVCVCV